MKKLILLMLLVLSLVLVSCDNSVSDKGKLHIVSMGDNFEGVPSYQLKSCENDARATVEVLEKRALEAGITVIKQEFIGITDATSDNLTNALNTVKNSASSNDLTVIFLSTHGHNDIKKKVNYSGSNSENAYFLLGDGSDRMYFDDLMKAANSITGTVLILADLCYSGAFIEQNNITFNIDNYSGTDPVRILFSDGVVRESSKVFVLSASTYFQLSYAGGDNELSVFTNYMLKALGMSYFDAEGVHYASSIPAKKGNRILLSDIYAQIYKESRKDSANQVVQMSSGTNDLVLFTY